MWSVEDCEARKEASQRAMTDKAPILSATSKFMTSRQDKSKGTRNAPSDDKTVLVEDVLNKSREVSCPFLEASEMNDKHSRDIL